jgi:SNF2 family DNA or RNA helicase
VYDIANAMSIAENVGIYHPKLFRETIMDEAEYFSKYFIFHEENEDDEDFPKVTVTNIQLSIDDEQYETIHQQKALEATFRTPTFRVGDRMCSNHSFKPDYVKKLLKKVEKGFKVIIYSAFKGNGIYVISNMLKERGQKFVMIRGDDNPVVRSQNFLQFCQVDSGVDICLTSPAGSQVFV